MDNITNSVAELDLASNLPPVPSAGDKSAASSSSTVQTSSTSTLSSISTPPVPADVSSMSDYELILYVQEQERKKLIEKRQLKALKAGKAAEDQEHKFWDTQPMLGFNTTVDNETNGPIDPNVDVALVKSDAFAMPAGFTWCELDILNPSEAQEIYKLLAENYVEDDEAMFRFDYSIPFLQWALTPPGYSKNLHIGVRYGPKNKLMGIITAIPLTMDVNSAVREMVEINFLCVHKKLRSNRLAPVLIKEITRRVNLMGRWQAIYTAGVLLPKPISRCRYWHRSLQFKKLLEVRFTYLPPQQVGTGIGIGRGTGRGRGRSRGMYMKSTTHPTPNLPICRQSLAKSKLSPCRRVQ